VASEANADPDVLINRPPKPGVAGSNPAGGTQKSGILGELPIDISVLFARLVVLFHCTFHCTRDRARILLVHMVARDAPAVVEYRRLSQDASRGDGARYRDSLEPSICTG